VQPALWFGSPSRALPRFLFLLFFGATCTRLCAASGTLSRVLFLFFFGANCTFFSTASSCLSGFLLFRIGATCARFPSSTPRGPGRVDAGAGQESGKAHARQKFLHPLCVHHRPPRLCEIDCRMLKIPPSGSAQKRHPHTPSRESSRESHEVVRVRRYYLRPWKQPWAGFGIPWG
jgi:hypothetical protein